MKRRWLLFKAGLALRRWLKNRAEESDQATDIFAKMAPPKAR